MKFRRNCWRSFSSHANQIQRVSWKLQGGDTVLSSGKRRARLWLAAGLASLWTAAIVVRLAQLQIADVQIWQGWGEKQHLTEIKLAPERGQLYDRMGRLMAVSVAAGSIFVRPHQVRDRRTTIEKLGQVLGMKHEDVETKLRKPEPFVWVKRQIPRATADKITALNLPGVGSLMEARRYYPYNDSGSRLLGKVGLDGTGLSGIELAYDRHLGGAQVRTAAIRDALGNIIETEPQAGFELPRGSALKLTIDAEMQSILDHELETGRRGANAKHALGVLADADTGEILALGQAPLLNLNNTRVASKQDLKNLVVETVFEPGSIMKPIVAAAALDAGVVGPEELFNCENGHFPFGPHLIKDVHPYGVMSFFDIVVRSSNIGMTKVGMRLGKERLHESLARFGFGQRSQLGLPGDTEGILRKVSGWANVDVATHSFGQGVAVTPLQMVRAVSAIANGGILPKLRLLVGESSQRGGTRVISAHTAKVVQEMMYGVVENKHGTGQKAFIPGVRIGGKTGTAQKPRPGGRGYQPGVYASSFIGFVDASSLGVDKRLTLIVIIDEPHAGSIYGGALAAPVFQRIMQRSLYVLSAEYELKGEQRPGEEAHIKPETTWPAGQTA